MEPETLFGLANALAGAGWLLLLILPRWRWTAPLVTSFIVPSVLAVVYLVLIVSFWHGAEGGFGSLQDVRTLFQNPHLLLAGWLHYLAFDLFIGSWEVRDAQRSQISHWLVAPCLLLTFWFGPVGLLCYLVVRFVRRGLLVIDENPPAF